MSISKDGPSRSNHYFDTSPAAPSRPLEAVLRVSGRELRLQTDSGVFARGRVDTGTAVLFEKAGPPPAGGALLDLGCGYGAVALWLAAQAPEARVWAVDVNSRALALCRRNAERNRLSNVTACPPEEVPPELRFAALYSNPPVRIGKQELHSLLARWLGRLEPGAPAWLVVQHHLGSDSLLRWLQAGWEARKVASKKAYRVLEVRA